MKKLTFTFALSVLIGSAIAQIPQKKSVALITKQTGTWCVNCGTWGWPLGHDLYDSAVASGNAIFMAIYDNIGSPYGSPDLVVAADGVFDDNFYTSGVPNFYVNGVGDPANNSDPGWSSFTDKNQALNLVDSFAATSPVVSSAANYTISGNTITSTANAQFWANTTGTYYMASYIVEDSVLASQYPIAVTPTAVHVGVLRAQMTASSFWGEQIATGSITSNNNASKSFTATLDSTWNKKHLRVFTVIWKQNGTKYDFVNAAKSSSPAVTAINELNNIENITLFPNPASNSVTISFNGKSELKLNISITDAVGRAVYSSENVAIVKGKNNIHISTKAFANGIYEVSLSSEDNKTTQKLVVNNK